MKKGESEIEKERVSVCERERERVEENWQEARRHFSTFSGIPKIFFFGPNESFFFLGGGDPVVEHWTTNLKNLGSNQALSSARRRLKARLFWFLGNVLA